MTIVRIPSIIQFIVVLMIPTGYNVAVRLQIDKQTNTNHLIIGFIVIALLGHLAIIHCGIIIIC